MFSYMWGYFCDMDVFMEICVVNKICVIEDCVYMMGVFWCGKVFGFWGDMVCYFM